MNNNNNNNNVRQCDDYNQINIKNEFEIGHTNDILLCSEIIVNSSKEIKNQRQTIDDSTVTTTSFKTATFDENLNPLRKSCDGCSKSKKKCNGTQPCHCCFRRSITCVYSLKLKPGPSSEKNSKVLLRPKKRKIEDELNDINNNQQQQKHQLFDDQLQHNDQQQHDNQQQHDKQQQQDLQIDFTPTQFIDYNQNIKNINVLQYSCSQNSENISRFQVISVPNEMNQNITPNNQNLAVLSCMSPHSFGLEEMRLTQIYIKYSSLSLPITCPKIICCGLQGIYDSGSNSNNSLQLAASICLTWCACALGAIIDQNVKFVLYIKNARKSILPYFDTVNDLVARCLFSLEIVFFLSSNLLKNKIFCLIENKLGSIYYPMGNLIVNILKSRYLEVSEFTTLLQKNLDLWMYHLYSAKRTVEIVEINLKPSTNQIPDYCCTINLQWIELIKTAQSICIEKDEELKKIEIELFLINLIGDPDNDTISYLTLNMSIFLRREMLGLSFHSFSSYIQLASFCLNTPFTIQSPSTWFWVHLLCQLLYKHIKCFNHSKENISNAKVVLNSLGQLLIRNRFDSDSPYRITVNQKIISSLSIDDFNVLTQTIYIYKNLQTNSIKSDDHIDSYESPSKDTIEIIKMLQPNLYTSIKKIYPDSFDENSTIYDASNDKNSDESITFNACEALFSLNNSINEFSSIGNNLNRSSSYQIERKIKNKFVLLPHTIIDDIADVLKLYEVNNIWKHINLVNNYSQIPHPKDITKTICIYEESIKSDYEMQVHSIFSKINSNSIISIHEAELPQPNEVISSDLYKNIGVTLTFIHSS